MALSIILFLLLTPLSFSVCPQNMSEWDEVKNENPDSQNRLLEGINLSK